MSRCKKGFEGKAFLWGSGTSRLTSAKLCAVGNRKSQCSAPMVCGLSQSTCERMGDCSAVGFQQDGAQEGNSGSDRERGTKKQIVDCTW